MRMRPGRPAASLLTTAGLTEDHVPDQVLEIDGGLSQGHFAARLQHLDVAAGHERQVFAAQEAVAHYRGRGVGWQPHVVAHAETYLSAIRFGVEVLLEHGADLDAADL